MNRYQKAYSYLMIPELKRLSRIPKLTQSEISTYLWLYECVWEAIKTGGASLTHKLARIIQQKRTLHNWQTGQRITYFFHICN